MEINKYIKQATKNKDKLKFITNSYKTCKTNNQKKNINISIFASSWSIFTLFTLVIITCEPPYCMINTLEIITCEPPYCVIMPVIVKDY